MKPLFAFTASALLAAGGTAHAAITYVDASLANTTLADGSSLGSPPTGGNVYDDNLWSLRTSGGLATGDTIFEAGGGEGVPTLLLTQTGLAEGIYGVYAYFVYAANVRWQISAGLEEGSLTNAFATGAQGTLDAANSSPGVTLASESTFVTAPQFIGGGDRTLAQIYLGQAVVDSSGELQVFIDNGAIINAGVNPGAANSRTWFDGIGYEVIPEPSCALLGLVGALGLLRRRR